MRGYEWVEDVVWFEEVIGYDVVWLGIEIGDVVCVWILVVIWVWWIKFFN